MRKRCASVAFGGVFAALVLAACGRSEPEPDFSQVCVDEQSRQRVDDERCDRGGSGAGWFYIPSARPAPPVGGAVDPSSGSHVRPASGRVAPVARGGFGGRATGGGGGS